MASTPPHLPVSFCKQVTMDAPLRLVWSVNALRWSAGSGSRCYCRLQVEFGVLHSARLSFWPCIFHGSVLYSPPGSVEDSSLFHFGSFFFFLILPEIFFHHHPHLLSSLCAPWHLPLLDASVITLFISPLLPCHKLPSLKNVILTVLCFGLTNFQKKKFGQLFFFFFLIDFAILGISWKTKYTQMELQRAWKAKFCTCGPSGLTLYYLKTPEC